MHMINGSSPQDAPINGGLQGIGSLADVLRGETVEKVVFRRRSTEFQLHGRAFRNFGREDSLQTSIFLCDAPKPPMGNMIAIPRKF
jgi:hypothetical protein